MDGNRLIISNTSPVINFAEIQRLDILEWLSGQIMRSSGGSR